MLQVFIKQQGQDELEFWSRFCLTVHETVPGIVNFGP